MKLVREFVARVAASGSLRASALNHEIRNHAMEHQSVVKRLTRLLAFGEIGEVLHGVRRFVFEQFNFEAAFSCIEHRVRFSSHRLILA